MAKDIRVEQQPAPLAALIAAPLRALVQAQAQAELETLNYVVDVGLGGSEEMRAVTLDFDIDQPVPDPADPGTVRHTAARVTVPLLALLGVPSVRIQRATVDFAVQIRRVSQRTVRTIARGKNAPQVELEGVYGPSVDPATPASLSVHLELAGKQEGETLAQLRHLLGDAMSATVQVPERLPRGPSVARGRERG